MKRKLAGVISGMIVTVLLIGCGRSDPNTSVIRKKTEGKGNSGAGSYMDQDIDQDRIVVGFSQIGSESDWRLTNTQSYREVFTEENGYNLIFSDAQQSQENQVKAIRNFILQEVDYIVLDPVVETGWDSVLEEAKEAKIPVIIADRKVSVEDLSLYRCWVGSDFHAEGVSAGKWLEKALEKQGRTEEEIHIVTLQGTIGSSAQIGRTGGFHEVAETHDNWIILDERDGDFTQAKAKEVMNGYLEQYSDIDVIISENDNMTFGVLEALTDAGIALEGEEKPIILSYDAVRDALWSVKRGEIDADFECNPLTAPYVHEIIQNLQAGKKVKRIRCVDETCFDQSMDLDSIIKERSY